ncbi:MCE family protein [Amycolatopsis acidicola]|uniref:MCE family protein n=1 Tax=Amycolatopsis acidicola TaxID=2596893 RepID=A0A5N0UUU7_9PSEU|nr:MlaD family protein [Amycolatopsis acidicola]KAA9153977.1 MCE family protein [Amycolatopsis acidicola]
MKRGTILRIALAAAVVIAVVAGYTLWPKGNDGYEVRLVMPSAAGLVGGAPVRVNGVDVGQVADIAAKDNQAVITVKLDNTHAPLHSGSTAWVETRSVLGERNIEIQPGPATNPAVPSGGLVEARPQVNVEDLLEALDPQTRQHVSGLVQQLNTTLAGSQNDVNATIHAAGPTVEALGEVLGAIGQDGPAIRELVTKLNGMTSTLAQRQDQLSGTVRNLASVAETAADQQEQLTSALSQLPATLSAAKTGLDKMPAAADATQPLLDDLRPVADKLPGVANDLGPLLTDLRPTIADLRPTLDSANTLLDYTPGLLDAVHNTAPGLNAAVQGLAPTLKYWRPYTPELAGFLANWGSVFAAYDSVGHYIRGLVVLSPTSANSLPVNSLPGFTRQVAPKPGEAGGQPWTDANGEGMR